MRLVCELVEFGVFLTSCLSVFVCGCVDVVLASIDWCETGAFNDWTNSLSVLLDWLVDEFNFSLSDGWLDFNVFLSLKLLLLECGADIFSLKELWVELIEESSFDWFWGGGYNIVMR